MEPFIGTQFSGTEWTFSLPEDQQREEDVFTVFPTAPEVPSDPVITGVRAEKYNFAMGENAIGRDRVEEALYAGAENNLRLKVIGDQRLRAQRIRQSVAEDIVRGKEGPLTDREKQVIQNLTVRELEAAVDDPSVIMEKLYGEQIIDLANSVSPTTAYHRAVEAGQAAKADEQAETGSRIIAGKEVAQRLLEDIEERWKSAGWMSTVSNYAEQIVPFFSWYNIQNALGKTEGARFLPGNNMEDQIRNYYTLPLSEASDRLRAAVETMEAANPLDAMNYLRALLSLTNTGRVVDNLLGVADIVSVAPIATAAKVTGAATRATGALVKDVVRVASKPSVKSTEILEAAGERTLMATEYFNKTVSAIRDRATTQSQLASWDDMFGKLPLLFNPKAFVEGGELAKSATFLAKVTDELTTSSARMLDGVLVEPVQIGRLTPGTPAFEEAVREAADRVGKSYPHLTDNIMWAEPGIPRASVTGAEETLSGTYHVDLYFGWRGGVPFEREVEAQWRINQNGLKNAEVVPVGNGFGIKVKSIPLNETDPKVRSLLTPSEAPTPRSKKNLLMSWARTPNDLLPKDIVEARAIATYGISKMVEMAQTMLKDVTRGLDRASRKDFDTFLSMQNSTRNPDSGIPGVFSRSLSEFEQDWLARFGRSPSEAEATAYMKYVQINDMEYAVLNLVNYKNKSAQGIQGIKLPLGRSYDDFAASSLVTEGRIIRDDPFKLDDSFSFLLWDANPANLPHGWNGNSQLVKGGVDNLKDRIEKEGLSWVQLTREGEKKLRADPRYADFLPEGKIDYLLMKSPRAEPLPINQLPYRPGGHIKYKDGFYISQPEISKRTRKGGAEVHYYHGDSNMAHFIREADAKDIMQRVEKARQIYHTSKTEGKGLSELTTYLQNELPGMFSVKEFTSLFRKGGPFKIETPFFVRQAGASVNDTHNLSTMYTNMRVAGDDVHSLAMQRMDSQYFKERGDILPSYAWRGSDDAPVIQEVAAELVDPLKTLESAFQNVIKSKYLDDLRVKTTERFVNEFAGILDVPIEQLRANPWVHLLDPAFKKGADKQDVQAAKNLRRTLLEFLNIQTPLEKEIGYIKQKLSDSIYSRIGDDGMRRLEKGRELLDNFGLGSTQDAIRFMRSLAFHEKLGLYNPKHLFLQAQGMATTLSVEGPVRGMKAASAYTFHRAMLMNNSPKISDAMASAAKSFGWKADELKESFDAGYRSGFFRVGGEVAYHDLGATPSLVQTRFGRALDHGTFFFREGERINRITAWNAAYLRWKELNPGKALNDLEISRILNRADDLAGNMSRASNAMWQQGIFSIPTQFWGYQARLSELFLGKRLTPAEKARLVTGYSIMYGIPTGAAATGLGLVWPWQEATRQYMLENGMAYNDSVLQKIMTDGIGGVAAGVIYGEDVNFSEQFSPQGLSVVKDLLKGDKGIVDLLIGVSGTTLRDNVKAIHPFAMALGKVAGLDGGYDLQVRDFTDALSVASSFSNASKAMHAYYTQEFWSKNEQKIHAGNVSAVQALIIGATGLVPKHVTDAYAMVASLKDRQAMQKELQTEIIKQLRLGFKADSVDQANQHFKRAQIHYMAGQFTPQEYHRILEQAARGYSSLADNIALKYAQTSPERMRDYLRNPRGDQ